LKSTNIGSSYNEFKPSNKNNPVLFRGPKYMQFAEVAAIYGQ